MHPLVTVITPSYNQGSYIRNTIESVLNQDYEDIEYIVVDGGSKDDTISILQEYKDRLTYISEPDNGQSDAINKGFKMANGSILAWLNSDDIYEPGCVSKAVELLEKSPKAAMVYGEGHIIDENGRKFKQFEYTRDFSMWALVNIWDYIMQPTTFFRSVALQKVGYLNERLNWTMDWDLWIRLSMQYDILYTDKFLACSREYGETKTSTGMDKRLEEIHRLMKKYSGKGMPFGYEIYLNSEILAHQYQEPDKREAMQERMADMINLQPVPDKNGCCFTSANFMFRPGVFQKIIVIKIMEERKTHITIFLNEQEFLSDDFCAGLHLISVVLNHQESCNYIRAEIESEGLGQLKFQRDSWIKIFVVDYTEDMKILQGPDKSHETVNH